MEDNLSRLSNGKKCILGIQHLFAMFGATILVPILTGLNPSMALIGAGIGTWIFHTVTGFKVPVFLGSSFAFLGAIGSVVASQGIPYAQGGIIFAGLVYVVLSLIIKIIGTDVMTKLFPPVVTGPVIVVIGLGLAPTALGNAGLINTTNIENFKINWISVGIAVFTLAVVIIFNIFIKGFFKLVPILMGFAAGYILSIILDLTIGTHYVDFNLFKEAAWVNIPYVTKDFFTLPKFEMGAILSIAPIALVTFMEHIGDITVNGSVVGKNFIKDPGLHRTLLGDGLATAVGGLIGAPANTTYGENTAVLATTKVYDPSVLRIAATFAIILGFFGKFGAVLSAVPQPVLGGVSILLYGMISSIGIRTLAESNLDFSHSRNLVIVALILVTGLGLYSGIQIGSITLSGLFIAVLVGVIANLILPEKSDEVESK